MNIKTKIKKIYRVLWQIDIIFKKIFTNYDVKMIRSTKLLLNIMCHQTLIRDDEC